MFFCKRNNNKHAQSMSYMHLTEDYKKNVVPINLKDMKNE